MYTIRSNVTLHDVHSIPGALMSSVRVAEATEISPNDISLLASDPTGQPIGSLLLTPDKRAGERVASYSVATLQVSPEHKNQGIECLLLREGGRLAAQRGAKRIHVTVRPANCELVSVCQDLGKSDGVSFVLCLGHGGL